MQIGLGQFLAIHPRLLEVACSTHSYVQLERRKEAETAGLVPEDDPRTLPDDRGNFAIMHACLLYTSPSPRDRTRSRMPSSA